MKKVILALALAAGVSMSAQSLVVSQFDSSQPGEYVGLGSWNNGVVDQFTFNAGAMTIAAVGGGNPDDTGYFVSDLSFTFPTSINAALYSFVNVTARVESGNLSNGFSVIFLDSQGSIALYATFAASEFSAPTFTLSSQQLVAHPESGNASDIAYFGIQGAGTNVAFRMSFDSVVLSAAPIPEPTTYAAIFGALALGFVVYRRRQAAVA